MNSLAYKIAKAEVKYLFFLFLLNSLSLTTKNPTLLLFSLSNVSLLTQPQFISKQLIETQICKQLISQKQHKLTQSQDPNQHKLDLPCVGDGGLEG